MSNWAEQQMSNLRDQAYQLDQQRYHRENQEVSSSSNANAPRSPRHENDPLRYNIHMTRNDIHVRQEEIPIYEDDKKS